MSKTKPTAKDAVTSEEKQDRGNAKGTEPENAVSAKDAKKVDVKKTK